MPAIPTFWRRCEEDCSEFKHRVGYRVRHYCNKQTEITANILGRLMPI